MISINLGSDLYIDEVAQLLLNMSKSVNYARTEYSYEVEGDVSKFTYAGLPKWDESHVVEFLQGTGVEFLTSETNEEPPEEDPNQTTIYDYLESENVDSPCEEPEEEFDDTDYQPQPTMYGGSVIGLSKEQEEHLNSEYGRLMEEFARREKTPAQVMAEFQEIIASMQAAKKTVTTFAR